MEKENYIKVYIPSSIYCAEEKRIIAQILLNRVLEKGKEKELIFKWGKKKFYIKKLKINNQKGG